MKTYRICARLPKLKGEGHTKRIFWHNRSMGMVPFKADATRVTAQASDDIIRRLKDRGAIDIRLVPGAATREQAAEAAYEVECGHGEG